MRVAGDDLDRPIRHINVKLQASIEIGPFVDHEESDFPSSKRERWSWPSLPRDCRLRTAGPPARKAANDPHPLN
jgi:hypothetical protein